jgi:hypothetical protein
MDTFAKRIEASSQLSSAVYFPESRELRVVFKYASSPCLYAYLNVPPEVWAAMLEAPSLGSFVGRQIKGIFDFDKRVQPATLEQQAKDFAALLASLEPATITQG